MVYLLDNGKVIGTIQERFLTDEFVSELLSIGIRLKKENIQPETNLNLGGAYDPGDNFYEVM